MKITTHPTDHVLVRARTKSDWDQCKFVLLHITKEWGLTMSRRLDAIHPFKSDPHLYCHTYWDAPLNYYTCPLQSDIGRILSYLKMDHETWTFVELDDPEEPDRLETPHSDLDTHMMMINAGGNASYMCFGRHTCEEYATEGFSLKGILEERLVF